MKGVVKAYHLGFKVNLQQVRKELAFSEEKREPSFLLYKVGEDSYVYLKDYGSVVFFNCLPHVEEEILLLVNNRKVDINDIPTERIMIFFGDSESYTVDFGRVTVPEITIDIAHIIMLNLAQSVALDFYLTRSEDLLAATIQFSDQLEKNGKIELSRRKLRMFVGKTMNLKNRIAENLFIFETSQLAWSNEALAELDSALNEELDIVNRHHGIQHNLDVIKENAELFKDILQHKHSSILEWIIILLILLEVVQLFVEKLN